MRAKLRVSVSPSLKVACRVTVSTCRNHAALDNLDYERSGHTGFASSGDLALKLSKDNFGWVIADNTYNPSYTYEVGDTVYYDGYLYTCNSAIRTPEPFDYDKWDKITLERLIWYKQDKLTAGAGIAIVGSTILATHGCHVIETGALVKKRYSEISDYKIVFLYGYKDNIDAPNQFCFCFMPDQLQVDGEDLQFYTEAGSNYWQYPIRVKRHSDGYVYWYSGYDYFGNTTFYVTKIVGVR